MSDIEKGIAGFLTGLITIAVLATLVSPKSQTPQVLQATGGALAQSLTAAEGATGTGATPGPG